MWNYIRPISKFNDILDKGDTSFYAWDINEKGELEFLALISYREYHPSNQKWKYVTI